MPAGSGTGIPDAARRLATISPRFRRAVRRATHANFFFVNIGAHDGITNDPVYPFLRQYDWAGIAVEPSADTCAELRSNYRAFSRVKIERAAIAASPRPFHHVRAGAGVPSWVAQLSTLDREFLVRSLRRIRYFEVGQQLPENVEQQIVQSDVPCLTFDHLMAKHGADRVDFINVDAEGLDYEVLQSIDLARWQPQLICFESAGMETEQLRAIECRLRQYAYVWLDTVEVFSTVWVQRRIAATYLDRARSLFGRCWRHAATW